MVEVSGIHCDDVELSLVWLSSSVALRDVEAKVEEVQPAVLLLQRLDTPRPARADPPSLFPSTLR